MKKSWHPLLMKNQERVWLEEKKALEERKKLDQLRKEKEEERQLQELQRLQEEQTGRKRTEKLEWMYATPATGSGANSNDLEDYLLGKKRVDKILVGDENQALGASHKSFIAVQHANTVRDTAAKVREDPLFMIKQQEQAALQALRDNPLRLKEMQERNGFATKMGKKDKDRKKRKHRSRSSSRRPHYRERALSRSMSPEYPPREYREKHHRSRRRSQSPHRGTSGSSPGHRRHNHDRRERYIRGDDMPLRRDSRSPPSTHHQNSIPENNYRTSLRPPRLDDEPRGQCSAHSGSPGLSSSGNDVTGEKSSRADKLAAMIANASEVDEERRQRLATRLAEERAEMELENKLRARSGGSSSFISNQQKRVFGGMDGGLGDYMRRGKMGLVVERE